MPGSGFDEGDLVTTPMRSQQRVKARVVTSSEKDMAALVEIDKHAEHF
jgi:hypothetical protein